MDFYEDNPWFMKRNVLCVWLNISILMNGDNVSIWWFSVEICKYKPGYKSHDLL